MTDLREQPAKDAAEEAAVQTFLAYHDNSPWAVAKVAAGLVLNPEGLDYMRREVAARADAKARFDKDNAVFEATRRKEMGLEPEEPSVEIPAQ